MDQRVSAGAIRQNGRKGVGWHVILIHCPSCERMKEQEVDVV
jgi:hypothetical protein